MQLAERPTARLTIIDTRLRGGVCSWAQHTPALRRREGPWEDVSPFVTFFYPGKRRKRRSNEHLLFGVTSVADPLRMNFISVCWRQLLPEALCVWAVCLSHFLWARYLRNTCWEFLQIWHKRPLGLQNKPSGFGSQRSRSPWTHQTHFFPPCFKNSRQIMVKNVTQISSRVWW